MARTPTLTPEERKARQDKWNQQALADKKKRYRNDPQYKREIQTAMREKYQDDKGIDPSSVKNAKDFLPKLHLIGRQREVSGREQLTFNLREVATALGGYHVNVLYRWVRSGIFPEPPHTSGRERVFTESEMRGLATAFAAHQEVKLYFQAKDKATIAALFSAV